MDVVVLVVLEEAVAAVSATVLLRHTVVVAVGTERRHLRLAVEGESSSYNNNLLQHTDMDQVPGRLPRPRSRLQSVLRHDHNYRPGRITMNGRCCTPKPSMTTPRALQQYDTAVRK